MTDAELRGRLLSYFYGLRNSNAGWVPVSDVILSGLERVSDEAIAGVCRQLADGGFIEWTAYLQGPTIGSVRIKGPGVDAVERGKSTSLEIRFPNAGRPDLPAAMPAIKEPERINLTVGLKLLQEHLPAEEAKARLRQPPQKPPDLVTLKPTFMGMSIDLKELWRRFRFWRESRTERQK